MTIKNRNLTAGMTLVARYHKQEHKCQVIQGEGDKVRYRLEDGREFKSPSAAGMAVTGHACDGWVFWSLEVTANAPAAGTQTEATNPPAEPSTERAPSAEMPANTDAESIPPETNSILAPTAEEPAPAKKRLIFRAPNQKGTGSQTRWYCQACGKSFLADLGVLPTNCPQGHPAS
jgi:hypothetical protein